MFNFGGQQTFITTTYGYDLNLDVRTVEAMAERLVPYVYQEELYGLMPSNLPKLTVGGLLMRVARLQQLVELLSENQQQALKNAQAALAATKEAWHVHYVGKLHREFKSRLESLELYLSEASDNLRAFAENYNSQMEKRVICEGLLREAVGMEEPSPEMRNRLPGLDNGIRRYIEAGNFRWDSRLEAVYPSTDYWYLYANVLINKPSKTGPAT